MSPTGIFTISLDFELHWGVSDVKTVDAYRYNLDHTREAITAMLNLFSKEGIHATWATVGLLFARHKQELLQIKQEATHLPQYTDARLNNFTLIDHIGEHSSSDPYHFAPEVIQQIAQTPHQEIATHTFSHYYCLEPGQDVDSFREDLSLAILMAQKHDLPLTSIVFPRNQYRKEYTSAAYGLGLKTFRGNENHWIYAPTPGRKQTALRRMYRLLDAYLPLTGSHAAALTWAPGELLNIPSSRFLRPYHPNLAFLDGLKLQRILTAMTAAAKQKKVFHLWWHPHNFGNHVKQNMMFLVKIITHYQKLQQTYAMRSLTMKEIYEELQNASHA